MNKFISFSALSILLVSLILAVGCKKKNDDTIVTSPVPEVSTGNYTNVLLSTIDFTGNVTADHGYVVTKRGFCWSSSSQNPTIQNDTMEIGTGAGSFNGTLKVLKGQTTYNIRAFATNMNGTGYGSVVGVTTIDSTIADADGNHYRLVQIGSQVWMAENLKTIKYNDGTSITQVTDGVAWAGLTTPGYCWYSNDPATYKTTYGALYNWFAVNTGKLAPVGWHVPTDAEFTVLTDFLGGEGVAGGTMKEAGTAHWPSPNTATNSSGFTALPAGYRSSDGSFLLFGNKGSWWCSSEYGTFSAWYRGLLYNLSSVTIHGDVKSCGLSVRCLRD